MFFILRDKYKNLIYFFPLFTSVYLLFASFFFVREICISLKTTFLKILNLTLKRYYPLSQKDVTPKRYYKKKAKDITQYRVLGNIFCFFFVVSFRGKGSYSKDAKGRNTYRLFCSNTCEAFPSLDKGRLLSSNKIGWDKQVCFVSAANRLFSRYLKAT